MRTWLVDGYNVIHAVPTLAQQLDRSLEAARNALISECRRVRAQQKDASITIVFDGTHSAADGHVRQERTEGVAVVFTRRGETADERILSLLRARRDRGECIVVSDDTYVSNNARAHGARAMSVADFSARATPIRPPARRLRGGDVKSTPSARTARAITEEYRRYLEEAH